jgi:hypothetical protein
MARAIKFGHSACYLPLSFPGVDVERLKGNSLRAYLEIRLQAVEEHLLALYDRYGGEQGGVWLASYWRGRMPDDEYWDGVFELDYLEATRVALLEALRTLQA